MLKRLFDISSVIITLLLLIMSFLPILGAAVTEETSDSSEPPSENSAEFKETMVFQGQVIDGITGKGIPFALLTLFNDAAKFQEETDYEGLFMIEIGAGGYEVIINANGYHELHENIYGRPDQIIKVRYELRPIEKSDRPHDEPIKNGERDKLSPGDLEMPGEDFQINGDRTAESIIKSFGFGESVIISNGNSGSFIAIIYGSRDHPDHITILSYSSRYIGAGDIYDRTDALISRNEPIAIKTIFKQTFSNLIEYNDTNNDGLFNKMERPLSYDSFERREPVYKKASMNTAWARSEISEVKHKERVEYSFSLTARNLPYMIAGDHERIKPRGNLDFVKFTFHIFMNKERVSRDDIPVFRINIETDDSGNRQKVLDAAFEEHRTFEGSKISTKTKYDYVIEGWDYHHSNNRNPKLFLEMDHSLMTAPENSIGDWLNRKAMDEQVNFKERMQYMDKDGMNKEMYVAHNEEKDYYELKEINEDNGHYTAESGSEEQTPTRNMEPENIDNPEPEEELILKQYDMPERIQNNQMRFVDDLYKINRFSWLSNVTADGEDRLIDFQIQHIGWLKMLIAGKPFNGISVHGGFNLPGAQRIHHDPTISSEIYELEIKSESIEPVKSWDKKLIISAMISLIIIVVILAGFYGTIGSASDRKMIPPKLPAENNNIPVLNKDQYKPKKPEDDEYYESYYVDWED